MQWWGLGSGRGLCLGPTGLKNALGWVWGGAESQRNRRGPGVPLLSESQGPSRLPWARAGRAIALCSSLAPLVLEDPSRLPVLLFPSLLPMFPGPMRPRRGPWRAEDLAWELSSLPRPIGQGKCSVHCPQSEPLRVPPGMGTPPPSQPPLRGTSPVQPPPLLPLQFPHVLPVHLGVPPISLGVEVSHQRLAGALVVPCFTF